MTAFARKCKYPTCSIPTKDRSGYCDSHRAKVQAAYASQPHRIEAKKFYQSPAWRRLRATILAARPTCEVCGRRPSKHVDHKRSIESGGASLDATNCQALCHGCHSRKTCKEDGGFGNKRSRAFRGSRL